MQFYLTSGVQRSTYQPNLRVGKPLFCEAWRPGFYCRTGVCTLLPAEEASGKRTKMPMLTLLVAWGWRGKTRSANQKQKTEKPIVPSFWTRHSRFFSSVSNTDNNSTTERLIRMPLGACSLVVWQCIAFATSFLLASQTTSVAATASCMTTSYTTTKLSHAPHHRFANRTIAIAMPFSVSNLLVSIA